IHGVRRLSGGRKNIRHARRPTSGLWQPDAYAGTASDLCRRTSRGLCAHSRRMGKDGSDPHSAGCGERGCAGGRSANSVENTDREERKDRREEGPAATKRSFSNGGGEETGTGREKKPIETQGKGVEQGRAGV